MRADPNPPLGRTVIGSEVGAIAGAAIGAAAGVQLTRRAALAGLAATGAAFAMAGCTPKQTTSAAQLIAGDVLGPVYTETERLIRQYDAALTSAPRIASLLGPLREEHRQHLIALASLIGLAMPAVSPGPSPSGVLLPPPHPVASGSSGAALPTSPTPTPTSPTPGGDVPATPPGASGADGIAGGTGAAGTAGTNGSPPSSGSGSASSPGSPSLPSGSTSTSSPGSTASGSPAPTPAMIKAQLSAAEKTAQTNAVAACVAVAADRVPIIAAIAACRATHIAALR